MKSARLILDVAQSGEQNMATDQALLERANDQQATLRIYYWIPATLSLGYFQSFTDRETHEHSLRCPAVRRATGGGAIVHDQEITYSLVLSKSHPHATANQDVYRLVHQTIVETLQEIGIDGCSVWTKHPAEQQEVNEGSGRQPFLCFQRRSPGDLVLGTDKVVGSAQRRLESGLLQHGSILLQRSRCAPELPGIEDIVQRKIDRDNFLARWIMKMENVVESEFVESTINAEESARALEIQQERFGNQAWTRKR